MLVGSIRILFFFLGGELLICVLELIRRGKIQLLIVEV